MRISGFSRYAFCCCVAVAMLGGCGESQPPIGGPGAMSQSRAVAARPDSTNYKVVHSFGAPPDGNYPAASLINVRGTLYGTTDGGGSVGSGSYSYCCGTVFSITPSGAEKVLYSFGKSPDGRNPLAGLIDVGGTLYGTTSAGGMNNCGYSSDYYPCGTVFSVTPSGSEKVLHIFRRPDGIDPVASLIEEEGTLYGTTENGGKHHRCGGSCGTIFSITTSGAEKVLHSFGKGNDGTYSVASLSEVKGKLYGTTTLGGAYGLGTVFSITPGDKEKVLHSFGNGTDGTLPNAALIDVNGTLYGTTLTGGASNCNSVDSCGTVFSSEKVLHAFGGDPDGAGPVSSLINVKGTLYGTTEYGGAYACDIGGRCGTIFSITTGGAEKVLRSFGSGTDGIHPMAGLIDVGGMLYGTTEYGGEYANGTVFALSP